jgi:hypothetical protein
MMRKQLLITFISSALVICMTSLLPSSMAAQGQIPSAVYSTTITAADIPPEFPPEAADILVATWKVDLTEAGTMIVYRNDEFGVDGRYTSSKSHLVIRDLRGPLACTDASGIATGIYSWSLENNELSLTPVLDRCFGRMFVLTLRPLQRL